MVYTDTWNAAFEATPADTDDVGDGAGAIRDIVLAVRERLAHDHYFNIAGTDADHGEHAKITFNAPTATPGSPGVNKAFLYSKDVSSKAELHYKDEDDNELQITSAGTLKGGIPTSAILLFESNVAIAGFTLLTNIDDYLVYIGKGSGAGGLTGGVARSGGTWTQPTHVHTMGTHQHQWYNYVDNVSDAQSYGVGGGAHDLSTRDGTGWTFGKYLQLDNVAGNDLIQDEYTTLVDPGDTNAGATANTWRPTGLVYTRQQKS